MSKHICPPMPVNLTMTSAEFDEDAEGAMAKIRPHGTITLVDRDGKARMQIVAPGPFPPCDDASCVAIREALEGLLSNIQMHHDGACPGITSADCLDAIFESAKIARAVLPSSEPVNAGSQRTTEKK